MPTERVADPTLAQIVEPIEAPLEAVRGWIAQALEPDEESLKPLLAHLGRFRGKQLRAVQVLLIGEALGHRTEVHTAVAGIVEMIHMATLAHDDLLDDAGERRGISCAHVEWGSHTAVLLGDFIYARAFERSTALPDRECSRVLAAATRRVCQGEIFQNLTQGRFELSEDDYYRQVDGKTAALYEGGAQLAAWYGEAGPAAVQACAEHGLLLGRAFQVVDDCLDLVGDQERVGKSLGTDWTGGKMTLPLIRLRDSLDPSGRAELAALFRGGSREDLETFRPQLDAALVSVRGTVEELLSRSAEAVSQLPENPSRDSLELLIDFVRIRRW